MFTTSYGQVSEPAADRATRAYARAIGALGNYYLRETNFARVQVLEALRVEEANLLNALDLARSQGLWAAATGCLQGL